MNDLDHLKRRVGHAVERLAEAQTTRREQQDSLLRLLSRLEATFESRHQELANCHSRIAALEKSNSQLGELLETVVHTVELSYAEDANDSIARAAKLAADLVDRNVKLSAPSGAAAELADDAEPPEPETGAAARGRAPDISFLPSVEDDERAGGDAGETHATSSGIQQKQADSDMSFEVITADELALEDQMDKEAGRLPPTVLQAVSAARQDLAGQERPWERKIADALAKVALAAEHLDEDEDPDLPDIPGIDNAAGFDIVDAGVESVADDEVAAGEDANPDSGARVLMARLQKAAEDAPPQSSSPANEQVEPPLRRSSGTDD